MWFHRSLHASGARPRIWTYDTWLLTWTGCDLDTWLQETKHSYHFCDAKNWFFKADLVACHAQLNFEATNFIVISSSVLLNCMSGPPNPNIMVLNRIFAWILTLCMYFCTYGIPNAISQFITCIILIFCRSESNVRGLHILATWIVVLE